MKKFYLEPTVSVKRPHSKSSSNSKKSSREICSMLIPSKLHSHHPIMFKSSIHSWVWDMTRLQSKQPFLKCQQIEKPCRIKWFGPSNNSREETSAKCELHVQTLRFLVQCTNVHFTVVRSFYANFIIFQRSWNFLEIFQICDFLK